MAHNDGCPVCQSNEQRHFLSRSGVPVHQNLLIRNRESATQTPRGVLDMVLCPSCGFIYNSSFDIHKLAYGSEYENTQSYSPYFNDYINDLIHELVDHKGVRGQKVVEVGCGKGVFLRRLVQAGSNEGVGFDPSFVGETEEFGGKLKFEKRYYTEDCSQIQADVVICRHVIEHVPDPVPLLKTIRKTLNGSPQARVFFETPCVDWILRNKVIFDFFYEHCSYFNKSSLTTAFQSAGFQVLSVEHIFDGQYLWLEAVAGEGIRGEDITETDYLDDLASQFVDYQNEWKKKMTRHLDSQPEGNRVAVWGAGAKGVTLLNLIDPHREKIDCVVDINPNKVGNFIPGTGHEIIAVDALEERNITSAFVMNPNYFNENREMIQTRKLNVNLLLDTEIKG